MTKKKKHNAKQTPAKPQPIPQPKPAEPYVISEELGRTIASFLEPYALYEPIPTDLSSNLRDDENLRELPKLRTLLEVIAVESRKSCRDKLRRGGKDFGKALEKAAFDAEFEGLPTDVFWLLSCLGGLGCFDYTGDVITESIEDLRAGRFPSGSETLNRCFVRLNHLARFEAVEYDLLRCHPQNPDSDVINDYPFEFSDCDVTEDLPYVPDDWVIRLLWMCAAQLCVDRTILVRDWEQAIKKEESDSGWRNGSTFQGLREDELRNAVKHRKLMMRALRYVLPRFSPRGPCASFGHTTDQFLGRLLETCAAARFDVASQAVALAYLTDPVTASETLPRETLTAIMTCVLAEALINAAAPSKADDVPVGELPLNLRTPDFERFRAALLAPPDNRRCAFERLAATEPADALRPTYARLAELQGALRSAAGKPVPELARAAVLLTDRMASSLAEAPALFERILMLAEGCSIAGELDRYGVPAARDLVMVLEAYAENLEHRLEKREHFLQHRAFQFVRMALEDAFDFDAVLAVDVDGDVDDEGEDEDDDEEGIEPEEDEYGWEVPVVPQDYVGIRVETPRLGHGSLVAFGRPRTSTGEPPRLFAIFEDHKDLSPRQFASERKLVNLKEFMEAFPKAADLLGSTAFLNGVCVIKSKREWRLAPIDDDLQSKETQARLGRLPHGLRAATLWFILGEEGFRKFTAETEDEDLLKFLRDVDAGRAQTVDCGGTTPPVP